MSVSQLRRSLLDQTWATFWYSLGIALYVLVIVALWPTVKQSSAVIEQYVAQFPEAFLKAFGIADMTHFEGFLGAEVLNFMWPLIISVFLIMAASAVVGGEMDRGTFELWLSIPRSRVSLLSAKLVAILIGLAVVVAVTAAAVAAAGPLANETIRPSGVLAAAVVLLSFGVCVGGYTALFSSVFATRATAAGLGAAITIGSYLLGIVSGLSKDVDWLKFFSLTTAYHPQQALQSGTVAAPEVVMLLAIGVLCAALSLLVFQRRDLAA